MATKTPKRKKPGPKLGSKRTNRNEQLRVRLIDGTLAGLQALTDREGLEIHEYLARLAGVKQTENREP